jgi:hypothetical protein
MTKVEVHLAILVIGKDTPNLGANFTCTFFQLKAIPGDHQEVPGTAAIFHNCYMDLPVHYKHLYKDWHNLYQKGNPTSYLSFIALK